MRKMHKLAWGVVVLTFCVLMMGCPRQTGRPMDAVQLPQVPDDPVWQAEPTPSVQLTVGSVTEYVVPRAREWEVSLQAVFPAIFALEEDHYIIYGTHKPVRLFRPRSSPGWDGINRWDLDGNTVEVRKFAENSGILGYVFAASIPGTEGPAFCQITDNTDETGNSVPGYSESPYSVFVYDRNGKEITSFEPNIGRSSRLGFVNGKPLEYPDTHFFETMGSNEQTGGWEVYVFDFSNGERRLDLRSGNPDLLSGPLAWLADTGEWICLKAQTVDGQVHSAILLVQKNGTALTMAPWTWPAYPWKQGDEGEYGISRVAPYMWQGHRYLLLGYYPDGESYSIQWAVRLDPGAESGEPVWARQEPANSHAQEQILLLGPDKHPFWIRFYSMSKLLRVIDLVSGKLAINTSVDVAMPIGLQGTFGNGASLVLRLKQDAGVPAVLIFDQNAGKLFRIDLKLPS